MHPGPFETQTIAHKFALIDDVKKKVSAAVWHRDGLGSFKMAKLDALDC